MRKIVMTICICIVFLLSGCTINQQTNTTIETSQTPVGTSNKMKVHFLDVGQGDSILVQSPNGKNLLVDGSTKDAGKEVVAYLKSHDVEKLDYVVATHPDADHIGGLISVLNSVSIKNFVDSGKVHTSQTYEEMLQLILDKNIPFIVPNIEDTIPLDDDLDITVLNVGEESDDNNEASIVLKITYGEVSFLLMGDADIRIEKEILERSNVKSTVLKAGHHGSDTSSSEDFIQAVKPEVTILSYGKDNSYGHPDAEVKSRLERISSQIYGTAVVGNIVVETDGVDYNVLTNGNVEPTEIADTVTEGINISSKDLRGEIVGITNSGGTTVSLKDWQLVSVAGNQTFKFPNISLLAGETIYVTSGPKAKEGSGYLKWTTGQMWRNDGDAATLLNSKGEVVSEFE
ncbi:MBL fold metallo-hydrolase [Psychrobacillus sp. FSL K6-2365]|uniref:MBL fold metallo-hydrolase n=1 Tax=Psychrobacillus TaxID=1221880 RepID=UPI0008E7D129|nr:MBL fold metallo-hydrolase [Psychrobacillus psychrodurans]MCZ8540570.1 lamin tail domain-containing protein [Psychrobacillus psychrodurans]SFM67320.1 Metal-dependent hydrolase, beta-lactamase superfamily II [Psychrobacillus psychrodurans]